MEDIGSGVKEKHVKEGRLGVWVRSTWVHGGLVVFGVFCLVFCLLVFIVVFLLSVLLCFLWGYLYSCTRTHGFTGPALKPSSMGVSSPTLQA